MIETVDVTAILDSDEFYDLTNNSSYVADNRTPADSFVLRHQFEDPVCVVSTADDDDGTCHAVGRNNSSVNANNTVTTSTSASFNAVRSCRRRQAAVTLPPDSPPPPNKKTARSRNSSGADGDKDSDEYRMKRERNNRFVRACREKARQRNEEVERRVDELTTENKELTAKADSLTRELDIYRNLLVSVGTPVPAEVDRELAEIHQQQQQQAE